MNTVKPMLAHQQKQLEQFATEFKLGFSGSDDYTSGVNDALWHMLNLLVTDNTFFFQALADMRYQYTAQVKE